MDVHLNPIPLELVVVVAAVDGADKDNAFVGRGYLLGIQVVRAIHASTRDKAHERVVAAFEYKLKDIFGVPNWLA